MAFKNKPRNRHSQILALNICPNRIIQYTEHFVNFGYHRKSLKSTLQKALKMFHQDVVTEKDKKDKYFIPAFTTFNEILPNINNTADTKTL